MNAIYKLLKEPFDPRVIHWRLAATNAKKAKAAGHKYPTKGVPVAYLNARDVMKRLDEVVGAENWQDDITIVGDRYVCRLGLLIDNKWIWKSDAAGGQYDVEAIKAGASDAFKRAAVKHGVGRYLYYLPAAKWVDLVNGKLSPNTLPPLPKWAIPKPKPPAATVVEKSETKLDRDIDQAIEEVFEEIIQSKTLPEAIQPDEFTINDSDRETL